MESDQKPTGMGSSPQKGEAPKTPTKEEALKAQVESPKVEVKVEPPGAIVGGVPETSGDREWQEWVQPVVDVISKLPDYLVVFIEQYKQPLLVLAIFLSGIIAVKVTLAVLDAINGIPLLAPIFELVGIGYTGWFVWRYLLKVETRQELYAEFQALKAQVLGRNSL
ncbi:MAG: CAAD domain-containing protein [Coleofasciculaceae cyanobacterium]